MVRDPDGTVVVVAERYRGQVVVLDFWAGWCEACVASIPRVRRLAAAFVERGLVVVGVNGSERPEVALQAARDYGIDYPIVLDPQFTFATQLGASGLPQLLVIDRDGTIVHRAREVDEATLAVVRRLLQ